MRHRLTIKEIFAAIALTGALALLWPPAAGAQETPDLACTNLDPAKRPPIPDPFTEWVTLLCAPDGQALAAGLGAETNTWVLHNSKQHVFLRALPDFLPDRAELVERYGDSARFVGAGGFRLTGELEENAQKMFEQGFPDVPSESYDAIYQLNMRSNYEEFIYNLFFYVEGGEPRRMIVCIDACQGSIAVDVTSFEALAAE